MPSDFFLQKKSQTIHFRSMALVSSFVLGDYCGSQKIKVLAKMLKHILSMKCTDYS
jgi:hypothetical protein